MFDAYRDLLRQSLLYGCWLTYRSENSAAESDRLTGDVFGCTARTVRNVRRRYREELERGGLGAKMDEVEAAV